MADSSFDIVSKVDRQEVDNALNQAAKELATRFDFRGTDTKIAWKGDEAVELTSSTEERVKAAVDVFKEKLIRRDISLKAFEAGERRPRVRRTKLPAPSNRALAARTPRRSPSSSATQAPRTSKPRSRATRSGSPARSATTCRPSSPC